MCAMEKFGIFVDVQNIYYTTKDSFGKQFNYRALWKYLSDRGQIMMAVAYATERNDERQRKFQSALRHIGFSVKLKPYIQRADGSTKGDWDVGITIDMLQSAVELDRMFLLSGDGDFDILLRTLQNDYGVPVEVYGVPGLTADSLQNASSRFHSITEALLI